MTNWVQALMPDEYVSSVYELDLDKLWEAGRRAILTDLDNTLVPWNSPQVPAALAALIERATARGFRLCIVSNNRGQRVADFARQIGVPFIAGARKPRTSAFSQALAAVAVRPEEAVMVGDQLFTDVRGANRCGIYSVLVLPLHPKEWWGTRVVRLIERLALRSLARRGLVAPKRDGERR